MAGSSKVISGLTDVFTYIAIFGSFFIFLKFLLDMARKSIEKPFALLKQDEFLKDNGYSYDYVFVFKVYEEDEKDNMNGLQMKYTMKNIIDRINVAGMETSCFYSCQRDEIYVKIRCNPKRLKVMADVVAYKLLLDQDRLRIKAQTGKKADRKNTDGTTNYLWSPINLIDEFQVSQFTPYQYIYGEYQIEPEFQSLYKQYPAGDKKHPFRAVDR